MSSLLSAITKRRRRSRTGCEPDEAEGQEITERTSDGICELLELDDPEANIMADPLVEGFLETSVDL